jgi:hypothetical protein
MTTLGKWIVGLVVAVPTAVVGACVWVLAQNDNGRMEAEQARAVVVSGKHWQEVLEGLAPLPRTTLTCKELTGEPKAPCRAAWVTSYGKGWLSSGYSFRVTFVDGRVESASSPEYTEW